MAIDGLGERSGGVGDGDGRCGVKQIDRLLTNVSVKLEALFPSWIRFVVVVRTELIVALDRTEFDADDHSARTPTRNTRHGPRNAAHLEDDKKSDREGHRTQWEHDLAEQLQQAMAPSVAITLLADRGFGDQKLYELLALLGCDYVIRFRGATLVETADGEVRPASEWVRPGGRAFLIRAAKVSGDRANVPGVVLVHARNLKESWCLATSLATRTASEIVKLYGRRFSKRPSAIPRTFASDSA